jgi:hypothetical protein
MGKFILVILLAALWFDHCVAQTTEILPVIFEKATSLSVEHKITIEEADISKMSYFYYGAYDNSTSEAFSGSITSTANPYTFAYTLNPGNAIKIRFLSRVEYTNWAGQLQTPAIPAQLIRYIGSKPTNLTAVVVNGDDVNVTWNSAYGSVSSYNVYFNSDEYSVSSSATSYTISNVNANNCIISVAAVYPDGNMLVSNNISLGLVQDIMTYNTDHTSDIVFPAKAITMIRFTDGFRFNALTSNHLMSTILGSNNKSADIVGFSNES